MRRYYIFALVLFALAACSQGQMPNGGNDDVIINLPESEYGYIFFDAETGTRGELIEPADKKLRGDFGVIGYTYMADDWTIAEVQAKPNVFDTTPQLVSYDTSKSIHTYSPIKPWLGTQKYAFFAYYPWGLTTSGGAEGNPYVDFTFSRDNLANQVDVMTAYAIDTNYATHSVGFNMKHRLTALDILARNLYTSGDLTISSMSIELNNLLYDSVRIPLNDRDEPELVYGGMAKTRTAAYTIIEQPIVVECGEEANLASGNAKSIIFIPQDQHIDTNNDGELEDFAMTGTLIVTYTDGNGTEHKNKEIDFTINKDLKAGRRYYVQANFAAGNVNIVILESDEWTDGPKVDHDFE